jgi:hypothetical protein
LITFHVVGGCCLHHAHAWPVVRSTFELCAAETSYPVHEHPCSESPEHPTHPVSPCLGGPCQYVAPQKTRPTEITASCAKLAPLADCWTGRPRPTLAGPAKSIPTHGRTFQGLRPHLVHQVLLI